MTRQSSAPCFCLPFFDKKKGYSGKKDKKRTIWGKRDERDWDSVSIENQKLPLQNYVRQRGWNEVDVYIDDGYSGTNFNRPGVRRLIEDAKAKRINVILVKDLSRFGRNYIEFGQYTDYHFLYFKSSLEIAIEG